jgi:integrase
MITPKKYTYYRSTFYHNGKQYNITGKTQREADRKADQKRRELERGEAAAGGDMSVRVWAYQWLDTFKASSVGYGHYKNYIGVLGGICARIGEKKLKDVTTEDLQQILNSAAGKSKSHISYLKYTIQAIFERARKSRHIIYDPAEDLTSPKGSVKPRRSITPDERIAILALAESHHGGLWIKTTLYCGLRPNESRALDWRHVDIDHALLHIEDAMKARTKVIGEPKTTSGVRDIPIPPPLLHTFRDARGAPDEPVFRQPTTGRRHTETSMRKLWCNFKRELDISLGAELYRNKIVKSLVAPDLVPYCLRHTYGTDLQTAGVPLNVAKYLMGHSDITVTANIYTHTSAETIASAGNALADFHSPP